MGGADRPFATAHNRHRLLARQTARLEDRFAKLFPAIPCDVDWRWGGTFGETRDGLPYIGSVRQFPARLFRARLRWERDHVQLDRGESAVDRFLQRPNRDAELFGFER